MASKAFRTCKHPGCPTLTKESYCDVHKKYRKETMKEYQKNYDTYKRDKKSKLYYCGSEWERIRGVILDKYNHVDLYEYYINKRIVLANTVHHIIPIKDDWNLRNDLDNLIPLSEGSHRVIEKMYKRNPDSKTKTQEILKTLLIKWEDDMLKHPLEAKKYMT